MQFDPKTRRYVDTNGNVMSPARVRREVNDYIETEKAKTAKQGGQLLNGTISLNSFFQRLKIQIESWHEVAGAIAYGGKAQIDRKRQSRIQSKIDSELRYLREFHKQAKASFESAREIAKRVVNSLIVSPLKEISGNLTPGQRREIERELYQALIGTSPSEVDPVTRRIINQLLKDADLVAGTIEIPADLAANLMGGTIPSRSAMYAEAAYATFQNNELMRESDAGATLGRRICPEDDASCEACVDAADTYFVPLEDLSPIGSLTCMSNCRCYFETAEPPTGVGLVVDRSQQADAVQ